MYRIEEEFGVQDFGGGKKGNKEQLLAFILIAVFKQIDNFPALLWPSLSHDLGNQLS